MSDQNKPEMKPTPPPAPDTEQPQETEQKKFDLSLTQLVGGALAAMTAAYLGSRMSVAGTVIGAAVASLVAGVAGTVYTSSLRHTRDKVRSVWTGRTNGTPVEVVVSRDTADEQGGTDARTAGVEPAAPVVAAATPPATPLATPLADPAARTPLWRTGRFWKRIAIGAVATFALTVGAITGLELVSGQALSGGDGTTVSRVRERAAEPSEQPSSAPSESPSDSPSDQPSESPSDQPSDQPSESPSEAPSEEPSASASAESSEPQAAEPSAQTSEEPNAQRETQESTAPSTDPAG